MDLQKVKSWFLKSLIGCLIAAAALAVVTVLLGQFTDILGKALFTILLIALHSLVSFGFIVNNEKQDTFDSLEFFTNATFIIIMFSFVTSIFGVWTILPGTLVLKLYSVYFVLLFAVLHGEVLAKAVNKQTSLVNMVYANYMFMAAVVGMLFIVIFLGDSETLELGSFFYRLLAALGIIDATLTLIAVILHKLYLQKHPDLHDNVFNMVQVPVNVPGQNAPQYAQVPMPQQKKKTNIFVVLLVGYIVLQVVGGIVVMAVGAIFR